MDANGSRKPIEHGAATDPGAGISTPITRNSARCYNVKQGRCQVSQQEKNPNAQSQNSERWNAVKVFSATMANQREQLGETVTNWLRANPKVKIVDKIVTQSSDEAFHCIAITLFYEAA